MPSSSPGPGGSAARPARAPRVIGERRGLWLFNLYPPLLLQRVRIVAIAPGYRRLTVRVARSVLTRNLNGTTFGGTIFAAADPFHAVMYWQALARRGLRVQAWLETASARFVRPAATALTLEFALGDADLDAAQQALETEGRHRATHRVEAVDRHGQTCALIECGVYLRLPRADQPSRSTF